MAQQVIFPRKTQCTGMKSYLKPQYYLNVMYAPAILSYFCSLDLTTNSETTNTGSRICSLNLFQRGKDTFITGYYSTWQNLVLIGLNKNWLLYPVNHQIRSLFFVKSHRSRKKNAISKEFSTHFKRQIHTHWAPLPIHLLWDYRNLTLCPVHIRPAGIYRDLGTDHQSPPSFSRNRSKPCPFKRLYISKSPPNF